MNTVTNGACGMLRCAVMMPKGRTTVEIQVHPNAARSSVVGFRDGVLHVRVSAPPVEGKANRELVKLLSAKLRVSKSSISIEKGATSRRKRVAIAGLENDQVMRLLGP